MSDPLISPDISEPSSGCSQLSDPTVEKLKEPLLESEARLAAIVSSSDNAILSKDLFGIIQSWNTGAELLFGYQSEEMMGQPIYRLIPSHLHEEERQILERISRGERIEHYETSRRRKNGSLIEVSMSVSPIRNQQGHPIAASTIARDITLEKAELRKQQCLHELASAVNESEALAEIYEKSLGAIIRSLNADRASILLCDDDGVMRFKASRKLSDNYQRAVEGHSPWKIDNPSPDPIILPDVEQANMESQLKATVLREGIRALAFIPLTYGRRLIGKFMVYFDAPYALSVQEIAFARTLAHTLAFGIERKRAEESLRQELADTKLLHDISAALIQENNVQALYEKILGAAMAIMHSDMASMQTVDEQENALRMLAWQGFEPDFGQIFRLNRPDTKTACSLARQLGQRVVMPDVETSDFVVGTPALDAHRKTGIRAAQSTPLFSRSGKMVGMISTHWRVPHQPSKRDLNLLDILARQAADLIERRQAEEALRQSESELRSFAGQLEQMVGNRTDELLQSQRRLRDLATELNLTEQRERQRIATELHDHLQQLLVLGKLKLGQGKRVMGSFPSGVDIMSQLDELLSDALKYTRTLVAELSPAVLHEHGLLAALKWLAEQMQHHHLTVSIELQIEELNLHKDDAILLFQSVRELLLNSAKHAGTGQATLRVTGANQVLRIEVQDYGKGFDPVATAGTASTAMSSKFGLFSIRERMKALDGTFDLESTLGGGTTAILTFPMDKPEKERSHEALKQARTAPQVSAANGSADNDQHTDTQRSKTIRVVLADDHAMIREGLRVVLEGYNDVQVVGEAKNGEEAIALVDALRPSVVVMDINMPKLNGIDATALIKARHPQVKVVGLSVNVTSHNHDAMMQAGANLLLTKEAAVDELYHAIKATQEVGKEIPATQ